MVAAGVGITLLPMLAVKPPVPTSASIRLIGFRDPPDAAAGHGVAAQFGDVRASCSRWRRCCASCRRRCSRRRHRPRKHARGASRREAAARGAEAMPRWLVAVLIALCALLWWAAHLGSSSHAADIDDAGAKQACDVLQVPATLDGSGAERPGRAGLPHGRRNADAAGGLQRRRARAFARGLPLRPRVAAIRRPTSRSAGDRCPRPAWPSACR